MKSESMRRKEREPVRVSARKLSLPISSCRVSVSERVPAIACLRLTSLSVVD